MVGVLTRAFAFKLNGESLAELAAAGVPDDVIRQIAPLQGESFPSRGALLARVEAVAGPSAQRHGDAIARAAQLMRPSRVGRLVGHVWRTYFAPSRLLPSFGAYLSILPVVFTFRLRLRYWLFTLRNRLAGSAGIAQALNDNVEGFDHNRKQVLSWLEGHRNRTESIMNVLRTIQGYDPAKARVLVVGPRNEAELLLLRAYGFSADNITSVDLFSYSPRITVMDMDKLSHPDGYFDIYYSSAVIKYSSDIQRSANEAMRVTRDGGLMAFGFMFGELTDIIPQGSDLSGGTRELLDLFGEHVDHVYWREEFPVAANDIRASTIFRLKK